MRIDETKEYASVLIGRKIVEIEDLIAKKWESHDFAEEAYRQISLLESPDREIYGFILNVMLGNWHQTSSAIDLIEKNSADLSTYQQIALKRMKAMVHIAKDEIIEAVTVLESIYKDIPEKYSWLKRTVAVDIRNATVRDVMSNNPGLVEKHQQWQNQLLKFTDYNPLLDGNDSDSLNTVVSEFFEAGTKLESTSRFSSSIREVLQFQFRNFFLSARTGYDTGVRATKRNIGLILYQWARIHNDPFLYLSSLYEFIENGNRADVEKIFTKHADLLLRNRQQAILLFDKTDKMSDTSTLLMTKLVVAKHIYDFLGDRECEIIDQRVANVLMEPPKDDTTLEQKRSAMKVVVPQSRRISPDWFLKYASNKLRSYDEHWWFYLDLFGTLKSVDISKSTEMAVQEIAEAIVSNFSSSQSMEDFNGIYAAFDMASQSTIVASRLADFLSKKYGSKELAFSKYPIFFSTLDSPDLSDAFKKYTIETIKEFQAESMLTGPPTSMTVYAYNRADVIWNIVQSNSSAISDFLEELAISSVKVCLNPYIAASLKKTVLRLIRLLAKKELSADLWKSELDVVRERFADFSTAIGSSLLTVGFPPIRFGALAGSTYLNMGGHLSSSLWNYIMRDKKESYENRIDCAQAMSEISQGKNEYSLLSFFVLAELMNDEFFPVSRTALIEAASLTHFPESAVPMLCQSLFTASYSGNVSIRIAATYTIRHIYGRLENQYWHNQLEARLKELTEDDCRPVRQQATMILA